MVGWNKIIKPKEQGGLGIQSAKEKNIALLAKLNWRMYQEKDALWTKVILRKYCSRSRVNSKDPEKPPCSINWKAIKMGFPVFYNGIVWNIGNGVSIKFWTDRWVRGCAPRELIEGPINDMECNLAVVDLLQDNNWNWDALSFSLPSDIEDKIKAIPIQLFGRKEDMMIWRLTKDREFSTASAYMLARKDDGEANSFTGGWVWKIDTLPRIQSFLWLCHHRSIPVREMLASRGVQCDTTCLLCGNASESAIHLLRECPYAMQIWRKVGIPTMMEASYNLEMLQWLKANCLSSHDILSNGVPWKILFAFTVWNLWKHRNMVVFENSVLNPRLHYTCIKQAVDYFYCIGKSIYAKRWSSLQVQWIKLGAGWCKLNTDGPSLGNPEKAGGGGLIYDHRGEWLKGFSRGIGSTTSVIAKFWAVRDGLLLAAQMGIPFLEVECDAKIVTDLLLSNLLPNRTYTPLLLDCRSLLTKFQQIKVNHTYLEANSYADAMARMGCLQQDNFVVFNNPPTPEISSFVNSDVAGMYYVRRCARTMPNMAL